MKIIANILLISASIIISFLMFGQTNTSGRYMAFQISIIFIDFTYFILNWLGKEKRLLMAIKLKKLSYGASVVSVISISLLSSYFESKFDPKSFTLLIVLIIFSFLVFGFKNPISPESSN